MQLRSTTARDGTTRAPAGTLPGGRGVSEASKRRQRRRDREGASVSARRRRERAAAARVSGDQPGPSRFGGDGVEDIRAAASAARSKSHSSHQEVPNKGSEKKQLGLLYFQSGDLVRVAGVDGGIWREAHCGVVRPPSSLGRPHIYVHLTRFEPHHPLESAALDLAHTTHRLGLNTA